MTPTTAPRPAPPYADRHACPSCRLPIVPGDPRCRGCDVLLGHPLATAVFASLQDVDRRVAALRSVSHRVAPAPPPTVAPPAPARTGVRTSSVPAILLGLGALCLLVAAVAFLAVAWSWLGVGGRTAVLVGLTAAAGATGLTLRRRDLRLTAEALLAVALGLLVLDVLGAADAGWLGDPGAAALAVVVGVVLTTAGIAAVAIERRLVVPQLAAVTGAFVAQAALPSVAGRPLLIAGAAVVLLAGVARAGRSLRLDTTAVAAGVAAGLAWLDLVVTALVGVARLAADGLSAAELWASADGPALAVAAGLLTLPLAGWPHHVVGRASLAAAGAAATGVAVLPVLDDGVTPVAVASLVAAATWTTIAHMLPRPWTTVSLLPATVSLAPALLVALALAGQAAETATGPGPVIEPGTLLAAPALVVPTVLVAVALLLAVVRARPRGAWVRGVGAAVLLAAIATLALHPVPLWTVVAALAALGAVAATEALRRDGNDALVQAVAAAVVLAAAVAVAAPSSGLLVVPLALLTALAAASPAGRFPYTGELGGLALAPSGGALLWVVADLLGADVAVTGAPVLLVLGVLVLVRPRVEVEMTSAATALVSAAMAVTVADDVAVSLALHLTLAGALVSAHALAHPSRRPLAWAGAGLLVLASWVRLVDVGVAAPEPYTLPAATALLAVGVHRLLRERGASTRLALLPGLGLATVPSLLRVAEDGPVSLRAALLGLACLGLMLGGVRLRWSAPLVVGATVGGLLTLLELSPYAAQTPQWLLLGLGGLTLVAVGVTWERRVVDLRRATTYMGRLR